MLFQVMMLAFSNFMSHSSTLSYNNKKDSSMALSDTNLSFSPFSQKEIKIKMKYRRKKKLYSLHFFIFYQDKNTTQIHLKNILKVSYSYLSENSKIIQILLLML